MRVTPLILLLFVGFFSCEKVSDLDSSKYFVTTPDYEWVFPDDEIRTISINIGKANWDNIQGDMEMRIGRKFGSQTITPGITPMQATLLDAVPGDPVYVKAEINQGQDIWNKVGFRLKGNASLNSSWRSGIYKLPFKLQFDAFEDQHPEIKNQRFYGFREISFSPSFGDNTFMKEKLLGDLFRKQGVMACKVAYYKVFINFGQGSKYCGIYQAIESPAENMVKNQTGKDVGNVYKPESNFQSFSLAAFEKQSNKQLADYEDVKRLISVLNNASRLTNKEQWKKDLESIFDVQAFLKYLAVNNTVGNWDGYGQITHNYFLINIDGILSYVPYDFNLSFQMKGGNNRTALTFDMKEVTSQWPLIRYILDDPDYFQFYKTEVKQFISKSFNTEKMSSYLAKHRALLLPHFEGTAVEAPPYSHLSKPADFGRAVNDLENYIKDRHQAAIQFTN
jgi:spore coat protein H